LIGTTYVCTNIKALAGGKTVLYQLSYLPYREGRTRTCNHGLQKPVIGTAYAKKKGVR